MSEKIDDIVKYTPNMLDDYTTGVEIEAFGLGSMRYSRMCELMSQSTECPFIETNWNTHTSSHDEWQIKSDGSIRIDNSKSPNYSTPVEFVSPILVGANGLENLYNVINAIKHYGFDTNSSCGIHVHVGWKPFFNISVENMEMTSPYFAKLLYYFCKFEPIIDLMLTINRRGTANSYCKSNVYYVNSRELFPNIKRPGRNLRTIIDYAGGEKYMKLNFQTLYRNTVEHRAFPGFLDFDLTVAWIWFCQKFTHKAISMKTFADVPCSTFEDLMNFLCTDKDYKYKVLDSTREYVKTLYNHASMLNYVYSDYTKRSDKDKVMSQAQLNITKNGFLDNILTEGE